MALGVPTAIVTWLCLQEGHRVPGEGSLTCEGQGRGEGRNPGRILEPGERAGAHCACRKSGGLLWPLPQGTE